MEDITLESLLSRIEALEKKFTEVNYPYQIAPYPCVVDVTDRYSSGTSKRAYLLSDGQIKIVRMYAYGQPSGSCDTTPSTLGAMAVRAGVQVASADLKKKTVVTQKIFEKFGGMKWAYMGEFMVSDWGNLYSVLPDTPLGEIKQLEKETAELGEPFKMDPTASEWDNLKAAVSALEKAKEKKTNNPV